MVNVVLSAGKQNRKMFLFSVSMAGACTWYVACQKLY